MANRRKFFEKMAASQGFDPLIAANWYTQTKETIMSYKVYLPLPASCLSSFRLPFRPALLSRPCNDFSRRERAQY